VLAPPGSEISLNRLKSMPPVLFLWMKLMPLAGSEGPGWAVVMMSVSKH